jgi:hypothetical protein
MVKMDPRNVVSHNLAVYKNVSTPLNEGFLYPILVGLRYLYVIVGSCISLCSVKYYVLILEAGFRPYR